MNETDRLNLQKMISANNVHDCTEDIRNKKHSNLIKNDVQQLILIKNKYSRLSQSNPKEFDAICVSRCQFLFNNYTDIFNKIKKNEIDLNILGTFLECLEEIEKGNLNQHEGSYKIGKLLKELYIDSALKKGEYLDKKYESKKPDSRKPKKISYKDYKSL